MSLATGAVAGTMSYVVVGFTPTLFDDRGAELAVITTLVGLGRLVSAGGKYLSGWMFDRIGGPPAARLIMGSRGKVRPTVLRAFDRGEMTSILAKLP